MLHLFLNTFEIEIFSVNIIFKRSTQKHSPILHNKSDTDYKKANVKLRI